MSALPLKTNVVEFKVPKKPRIIEKEAPPDQRKHSVMPIRAAVDKRLTDNQVRVLAVLCSYTNRAGITWVGQARLGQDLGVSKQAISKQIKKLCELGYLEVVKHGFRGERANTIRVVYDPTVSVEDAIAMTSSQEDTRPPWMAKKELKEMQEEEFTPEQLEANKKRLAALIGSLATAKTGTNHQKFNMPADGQTLAVRRLKEEMEKKKTRQRKPVAKADHSQPNTVDHGQSSHSQPNAVDHERLHSQPHSQPLRVDQTSLNVGIEEVLSLYEEISNKRFNNSVKSTEIDLKVAEVLVEVGVTASDLDAALSAPMSLAEAADKILAGKV